jgi:hypothetical protein
MLLAIVGAGLLGVRCGEEGDGGLSRGNLSKVPPPPSVCGRATDLLDRDEVSPLGYSGEELLANVLGTSDKMLRNLPARHSPALHAASPQPPGPLATRQRALDHLLASKSGC